MKILKSEGVFWARETNHKGDNFRKDQENMK